MENLKNKILPNVKFILSQSVLIVSVSLGNAMAEPQGVFKNHEDSDQVVARVNGEAITKQDVSKIERAVSGLGKRGDGYRPSQADVIEEFVRFTLLHQEAEKLNFHLKKEFVESINRYKKSFLSSMYTEYLQKKLAPDEKALQAEYKKLLIRHPNQEYLPHFLILEDKESANKWIKALAEIQKDTGSKGVISKMAELSEGHGVGGSAGWVNRLQIDRDLFSMFSDLNPGQIILEPIEYHQVWYVVFLEEKRPSLKPSFSSLKKDLYQKVLSDRIEKHLITLEDSAEIRYVN